jgi:predicted  nucleic acid-binding Zn-ribbon protein
MFGGGGSISVAGMDPGAVADVRTVFNVIDLLTDRDRERVKADLASYADAMREASAIRDEIQRREEAVTHREQQATKHEEMLRQRLADVSERERQAQAELQKVEEKRLELEQYKRELRELLPPKIAA